MVVSEIKQKIFLSAATAVIFLIISAGFLFGVFDTLQAQLTDRFFTTGLADSDIVIIDIDEESLTAIGQWPWARSVHGQLLQKIESAKVVGFDVLFTEPSALNDDDIFATAISGFDGEVVLPAVIDEQSGRISYPVDVLREESTVGFVNTKPDRDGVVRYVELDRQGLVAFDTVLAGADAPADRIRVYYHGPAKTYTTISYYDVYSGGVPTQIFAGKTILVGASAAGLGDSYQTPFGSMPGVEIHANTIETLRSGQFLTDLPTPLSILIIFIVSALILLCVSAVRSLLKVSLLLAIILVTLVIASYVAFTLGILIPHLYLVILFIALAGVLLLLQYLFESKEKQFIRSSFAQYVAPEVISELYSSPDKLTLGGETRTLSILFSDIRGFTSISEKLSPQELMQQLNEYLEEMSEAVMQNKGLVDKYIGDAVMAFWGAPLENSQHAINACESVLVMMKALDSLNERWKQEGKPPFKIGVGVSTGDVVVGNMGSRRRFNYSIIGDEVNFSARIEGLTKQYGVDCLIGESTYHAIKDVPHLRAREIDEVMVKGKIEPRKIYQLLTAEITNSTEELLKHFAAGGEHYKKGNFTEALTSFKQALAIDEHDGPTKVFIERCEQLSKEPPENWNGVYEFKTK